MEYLDTYDENRNFLGKQPRDYVHKEGLWHNTVHCWLYDKNGNVYFQIRKDEHTFYTTASGHVLAGETIKQAFGREIKEEIGINIEYENSDLVDIVVWKMDKEKADGTMFRDRAFANVYVHEYKGNDTDFDFDVSELEGVVKVNANDALKLFENDNGEIPAQIVRCVDGKNIIENRNVRLNDFLVNKHETAIGKYGDILNKVIEITK